jgi:tRNA U34 5-methylaminomethyl-2-thiouridine-forming methyltransferase MnmC
MPPPFDDQSHTMVASDDGSFTAYSSEYEEHYHSTSDGALNESLNKHVIPAFSTQRHKASLTILDICFGLGFNTLATLHYLTTETINVPVTICSPELDAGLIASLTDFTYPEVFAPFLEIIVELARCGYYQDENLTIELYIGDAREYLRTIDRGFDIVYQDAFSPRVNPALWTQEYFADLARLLTDDGVITTYSTALKTRLALYGNGFNVYLIEGEGFRNGTIASRKELIGFKGVDMPHKIACNPDVRPLSDND